MQQRPRVGGSTFGFAQLASGLSRRITMLSRRMVAAGMAEAIACCSARGSSEMAMLDMPKSTATAALTRPRGHRSRPLSSGSEPFHESGSSSSSQVTTADSNESAREPTVDEMLFHAETQPNGMLMKTCRRLRSAKQHHCLASRLSAHMQSFASLQATRSNRDMRTGHRCGKLFKDGLR